MQNQLAGTEAVCFRCGATRALYGEVCAGCGFQPRDEGLLVAWLFSSDYLDGEQLKEAQQRIETGEQPSPGVQSLQVARRALGATLQTDPGLPLAQLLGLLVLSLLLTPLVSWVLWWHARLSQPRVAFQAFAIALPTSLLGLVVGLLLKLG